MKDFHFYAASVAQWATTSETRNLRDLIKLMEADKLSWSLWLVPCSHHDNYEINAFLPMVPGAQHLNYFEFKNGRKV